MLNSLFTIRDDAGRIALAVRIGLVLPALLLVFNSGEVQSQETTQSKPNVVLIIANDAGWADFGFQGSTDIPTPNLDQISKRGVRFSNAYAGSVDSMSRASLMTGLLHSRIGFETNPPQSEFILGTAPTVGLSPDQVTVFDRLKEFGYQTGFVGTWGLGAHHDNVQNGIVFRTGNRPTRQGVESFRGLLANSRSPWVGQASGLEALRHQFIGHNGVMKDQMVEDDLNGKYITDVFGDWSVDFIRSRHENKKPFFLCTSFTATGGPVQAKKVDLSKIDSMANGLSEKRRTYAAMMLAMDRQVGRIIDALRDPNNDGCTDDSIENRTLVLFVGDNGGDCCDDESNGSRNGILRGGKGDAWEGGLRVPMLIAGEVVRKNARGSSFDAPVHLVDILPTIANFASSKPKVYHELDGVDLMPFINDDLEGPPHEHLYFRVGPDHRVAIRMGNWKLHYLKNVGFALLDLSENPSEVNQRCQLESHPEIADKMKQILTDYEVQFPRPHWGVANHCVEFRFCEGLRSESNWSDKRIWSDEKMSSGLRSLTPLDGFANTGLVFRSLGAGSYRSRNDLTRTSGLPFIANYIRIRSREVKTVRDAKAMIVGNPILLTPSLDNVPASIQLDSVSPSQLHIEFDFHLEVQLYSDLRITGDGSDEYRFSGGISEYRRGCNILKIGKSAVTFAGPSKLSGTIEVRSGTLRIEHAAALGDATVIIHKEGKLLSTVPLSTETRSRIKGDGTMIFPD